MAHEITPAAEARVERSARRLRAALAAARKAIARGDAHGEIRITDRAVRVESQGETTWTAPW